ncbi:GNAT family N-acetyltransferase [Bacillus sp. BRMEA1]|uniref:GNAT family N-acetyltransferase n=1 Tax=Neobacillus endophyticus TaxID=2738405 RepID=UPI0015660CEB|nr:GNAT family N-acetyltransferase [Neobacillus endophyticus]NRD78528.1 GNAT family N-acetyltransferase [Neobacillus endophyticus]NRD79043.1 GNAT family N-acetyltransferase [Neobacillus endophyticus]
MNIEFKPIDRTNYIECIDLKLNEEQKKFVAPNIFSLVQAAYEPNLYPLGIYKDNIMIGFILYDYDNELNGWSMSRFMIDSNYQNQGIGKISIQKFIEFFTNKHGHLKLYTSASVDNQVAIDLYKKFGFEKKEVFEYEAGGRKHKDIRMIAQL